MNCRRYRLDQVANFRDLGGYACDGGVTRYGVIFRSTALNKATEEDIAKIEHLGVRTVIDLRFPSETKELPDRLGQDMDYINCSLMGTTKLEQLDIVNSSVVETKTLHRMYRLMLRNGGKEIKKALEVVADSEGAVLFHCAAGKDRTGILAGVAGVLGNNGVSINQVIQKPAVNGVAELVVITDKVETRHLNDAMMIFGEMSMIREVASVIRVYTQK